MEEYRCSGCGDPMPRGAFHDARAGDRKRPVTSRCKVCRRNDYYRARYPTVCACCREHRPIEAVEMCKVCLDGQGLRLCRGACAQVLPLLFKFYGASRVCKDCQKAKKTLTPPPGGSSNES